MEHGAPHHATIGELLWPALNFAIFAVVVVRALSGPIREFFRSRTEQLRDALEAGARARREAEALRGDLERELADLPRLRERLRGDLRAAADQQKQQLLDAGRRAAERIVSDARLLVEQEAAMARETLRTELVEQTTEAASALVRGALVPEDQSRFVREFVKGMEARP